MKTLINSAVTLSMAFMPMIANATEWQHFNAANSELPANEVLAIESSDSGIWIGTEDGLAQFDGTDWTVHTSVNSFLPDSRINDIHVDATGAIWVATYEGLAVYRNRMWEVLTVENSVLPTDLIRCVTSDADGNLWVGTWGAGLVRMGNGSSEHFHTLNSGLPSNGIYNLAVDPMGRVWAGTHSGGAAMFENGNWTVFDPGNSELPHAIVLSIGFTDDGAIWLGTHEGLARLMMDGVVEWQVYTSLYFGQSVHAFRDILSSENGDLWFATDAGLVRHRDGIFEFYHTGNSEIASNGCSSLAVDGNGNIFVGHLHSGMSVHNPDGVALSLGPVKTQLNIELYPNPASDDLTVKIPLKGDGQFQITVTDLSGRTVSEHAARRNSSGEVLQHTVDVSRLPVGTYILTVRTETDIAAAPFIKG